MARKKIMIVDDNKEFLEELEETLSLSGYDTVAVNDSRMAFDIAATSKPDLILLDLKMNGLNGFQVADCLKKSPETGHIPIIAMTGHFNKEEHYKLMATFGMATCIDKPFSPLELIVQIEILLGNNKKSRKESKKSSIPKE